MADYVPRCEKCGGVVNIDRWLCDKHFKAALKIPIEKFPLEVSIRSTLQTKGYSESKDLIPYKSSLRLPIDQATSTRRLHKPFRLSIHL